MYVVSRASLRAREPVRSMSAEEDEAVEPKPWVKEPERFVPAHDCLRLRFVGGAAAELAGDSFAAEPAANSFTPQYVHQVARTTYTTRDAPRAMPSATRHFERGALHDVTQHPPCTPQRTCAQRTCAYLHQIFDNEAIELPQASRPLKMEVLYTAASLDMWIRCADDAEPKAGAAMEP